MKRFCSLAVFLVLLSMTPVFCSETGAYVQYNLKIGQLIFKELTLMEKANQIFNMWMKNDITKTDAIKELNTITNVMGDVKKDIDSLSTQQSMQELHKVYGSSSGSLIASVKNHISFIEKNDSRDDAIREKIQQHLLSYIDNVYACQKMNIEAQLAFQQAMKLDREPDSIKEYFSWNNRIIRIMLAQVGISGDMERMLIRFSSGTIDNEEILKDEKELMNRAKALKKELDTIKPAPSVSALHGLFASSYDNYLAFHSSLYDYLESPSKDKSAKMQDDSKKANRLNFEFNEACFKFLEKNTGK